MVVCYITPMDFASRFVIESAAIEGQVIPAHQVEASGHMQAYKAMVGIAADHHATETDIKNWQNLIGAEQHLWGDYPLPTAFLGIYRAHNIRIGETVIGHETISGDMRSLVLDANTPHDWSTERKIQRAAYLHWRYERIHPFADGNGRSGRLFALWFLLHHRLPPVEFTAKDRVTEYYPCFGEDTPARMVVYFQSHLALA